MLLATGDALRVVVDAPRLAAAIRVPRGFAIGLTITASWAAAWFGGALVAGLAGLDLGLPRPALLGLGAAGLACAALLGAIAVLLWAGVRALRSRYVVGATLLAVGREGVEGPGTGPMPYASLERATLRSAPLRMPPPASPGAVLGRRIGVALGARARLDAVREVVLRIDGRDVAANLGPFADAAELDRLAHALAFELGRRSIPLELALDAP
ncbi:hypothetical protein OVA14_11275 [Agrococcus sp. SL85]|uniref:hypothetical protein n=1 Tax=Agrococcus sp. SL85 TaxID=2995141 RepID=UPI00226CF756|nr:hypothetical protein [Agrococcus sp. SL85]WAC65872.1 hypothetical protein OVA14_11275 [Agrococcus sp. SL85]